VTANLTWSRFFPPWLGFIALLLLLTVVFASQVYWAGYVKPWTMAFWQESVYWFSWGVLAPFVFMMCSRLYRGARAWTRYALGLSLGAILVIALQPLLAEVVGFAQWWLGWQLSIAKNAPPPMAQDLYFKTMRNAGINLPVYAGFVLAWHAVTHYRESRDRQLQAAKLESLLHQAQLQALRSQLNPHFLFNTLHSIAELVHENPKLAEQLILRLGELLRRLLESSSLTEVPLAEELDFIRAYVEIEQMRLGERLQVTWDVDPETLQAKVPSLILQPLIENAIQHGIAPIARSGSLVIRAIREGSFLHLQVRDTGPGLTPETESSQRGTGIGLTNTQQRLQRLYGERQSFKLAADNGLIVNVRIPLSIS
jgi:two-component system, LytTR family, sensor kinase